MGAGDRAREADACLSWEGLRAEWAAEGIKLKYLLGTNFSTQPSNVYAVRAADLKDSAKVALYTNFLSAMTMAFEFARANPRAAAQITYDLLPELQQTLKPVAAYASFLEIARMYGQSSRAGEPWGWSYLGNWSSYLRIVHNLGQTKSLLNVNDVVMNSLVVSANHHANRAQAIADAKAFKLSKTWESVAIRRRPTRSVAKWHGRLGYSPVPMPPSLWREYAVSSLLDTRTPTTRTASKRHLMASSCGLQGR